MCLRNLVFTTLFLQAAFAQAATHTGYPSLYYTPLIQEQSMTCEASARKAVYSDSGTVLAKLCNKEFRNCEIQGACVLVKSTGEKMALNYYRFDEKQDHSLFTVIDPQVCSYAFGFGKLDSKHAGLTCLKPYFAVAADPLEHRLGEVLFIPSLVGARLPDGQVHDGYVIVEDSAKDLVGTGSDRFIFFTGYQPDNEANAFKKLGLDNIDNHFKYEIITGAKADEVRSAREFKVLKTFNRTFKPNPPGPGFNKE